MTVSTEPDRDAPVEVAQGLQMAGEIPPINEEGIRRECADGADQRVVARRRARNVHQQCVDVPLLLHLVDVQDIGVREHV